jgi:hypothetical protein
MTEPVSGGSPALFWSAPNTSGDQLFRVASDGSSLFWSIQGITSAPLGGGTATSLTSSLSAGPFVAVDASNVYWVELLGPVAGSQVWSVPKEGGTATSLWSESESIVVAIAADATGIYFVNQGNLVVVDGGDSVPAPNTGSILMIPSGGGAATTLVSGLNYPNSVAVDGTNVYWTDFTGVSKAPIGGGATTVLAAEGGPGAISVEVDGSDAYWLNECFGTVKKIAK